MNRFSFFLLVTLSACATSASRPELQDLHPDLMRFYTQDEDLQHCQSPKYCNGIVVIDCDWPTDGPLNYYNNLTGELVMACGGTCMNPSIKKGKNCAACPPPEWSCSEQ